MSLQYDMFINLQPVH